MSRTSYTFSEEPRGAVYESLLEVGLSQSTMLGLIVQKRRTYPPRGADVLASLAPYLIEKRDVAEWPGTRLLAGYVEELRLYRYKPPVAKILERVAGGLFDWQNPDLPDDLHLLREDKSTWLGSIAHENDAWLDLAPTELANLREMAPMLTSLLKSGP